MNVGDLVTGCGRGLGIVISKKTMCRNIPSLKHFIYGVRWLDGCTTTGRGDALEVICE